MKIRKRICGTTSFISFMALLGVAGNSDLGLEPNFGRMVLKCLICLAVFIASLWIGGFIDV